jgi:hypothetical protein
MISARHDKDAAANSADIAIEYRSAAYRHREYPATNASSEMTAAVAGNKPNRRCSFVLINWNFLLVSFSFSATSKILRAPAWPSPLREFCVSSRTSSLPDNDFSEWNDWRPRYVTGDAQGEFAGFEWTGTIIDAANLPQAVVALINFMA